MPKTIKSTWPISVNLAFKVISGQKCHFAVDRK